MTCTVELSMQGSMDHLRLVWLTGESLLERVPFGRDPEGARYNVLVAVQEMITNILHHGYGGDDSQPIAVRFEASPTGFTVTVRDRGPAFDPLTVTDLAAEGMPDKPGGYGIMLARMVMDDMSYAREGGENVVRMHKEASSPAKVRSRP